MPATDPLPYPIASARPSTTLCPTCRGLRRVAAPRHRVAEVLFDHAGTEYAAEPCRTCDATGCLPGFQGLA